MTETLLTLIAYTYFSTFLWLVTDFRHYEWGDNEEFKYITHFCSLNPLVNVPLAVGSILFGGPFKVYTTYRNRKEAQRNLYI